MSDPEFSTSPTNPEMQQTPIKLAEQLNIPIDTLASQQLIVHDLAKAPVELLSERLADIEGKQGGTALIGVIEAGANALRVYSHYEDGKTAILIAAQQFDHKAGMDGKRAKIQIALLKPGEPMTIGRGDTLMAKRLDVSKDTKMSRNHFSIEATESGVKIQDLKSLNGTKLITSELLENNEQISADTIEDIGSLVTREAITVPEIKERIIDGIAFRVDGRILTRGNREAYAVTTTDKTGRQRQAIIYRSNSEGAMRMTPAIELEDNEDGTHSERYVKGAELSPFTQYTQETQLHPDFAYALADMVADVDSMPMITEDHLKMNTEQATYVMRDLEDQIEVFSFGDEKLAEEIAILRAGGYGKHDFQDIFNADIANEPQKLDQYINQLNDDIREAGIVPDFSKRGVVTRDMHPVLGEMAREVFTHKVGGIEYEWHMGVARSGEVWVDRIRYANAEPTTYGTDKQIPYSGILTSKPVEHFVQTTGLPEKYKRGSGKSSHYVNISRLLDQLEPIRQYRAQRELKR